MMTMHTTNFGKTCQLPVGGVHPVTVHGSFRWKIVFGYGLLLLTGINRKEGTVGGYDLAYQPRRMTLSVICDILGTA